MEITLLYEGFLENAGKHPDGEALIINKQIYTYGDLYQSALVIACALYQRKVSRNKRVIIMLEKSYMLYASILGILMAGATYIPLNPNYPFIRSRQILESSEASILLFHSEQDFSNLINNLDIEPINVESLFQSSANLADNIIAFSDIPKNLSSDIAYILFTSGSTGVPKGVMVSHGNASAFINWAIEAFEISDLDRLSGHSEVTFDLSIFDMFTAFNVGACLIPVVDLIDKTAPAHFILKNKISIWFSVPSVLTSMLFFGNLKSEFLENSLRWLIFCGETLIPEPVRRIMQEISNLNVANLYGPTEATVACSAYFLQSPPTIDANYIPIGWKTKNTEIFLWKDNNELAKMGETGEIYIAGDQVSLGYFNNPEETQKRFVPDPRFPDKKSICFKTGDLAVHCSEGPVFKGRKDFQIKFRGHRIEIGDIEHALSSIEGILECAVSLVVRPNKTDILVAFIRQNLPRPGSEILNFLKMQLPLYMIPSHIRIMENFPRTVNQKIDRRKLEKLF